MAGQLLSFFRTVTVEPVMLMDGACKEAMLLFIENVQLNKICSVKLGYPNEVCSNLTAFPQHSVSVQREFSMFAFYNSIIMSVLPLVYVLFMGAWSDKYGRKVPLLITLVAHTLYAGGYLLVNFMTNWPVEVLYLVTLVEALGGSNAGILSTSISYISDITREEQRTTRVSTANSVWFLGGPVGTLIGALIIKHNGYNLALGLVALAYIAAILYVVFIIKESHGPYAKKTLAAKGSLSLEATCSTKTKEKTTVATMLRDFFNWRRVVESFGTALKQREGRNRAILLTVLLANMIRRMARGFFMYMFVRRVLYWDATDYGFWITYRNLLAALGSLFLVPLLTKVMSFLDTTLVVVGAVSLMGEYLCYGMVGGPSLVFLMWLGPPIGIISNACVIAFKSMSTKLVTSSERGRITAVMAALNGLMPMAGYAAYSPIYYHTVDTFPAAQYFVAAGLNMIILVIFIILGLMRVSSYYDARDLEDGERETHAMMEAFRYRSSIKLKALARTLSGPGGKRIKQPLGTAACTKRRLSGISEISSTSSSDEAAIEADIPEASKWSVLITNAYIDDDEQQKKQQEQQQQQQEEEEEQQQEGKNSRNSDQSPAGYYSNWLSGVDIMAGEQLRVPMDNEAIRDPASCPQTPVLSYRRPSTDC